MCQGDFLSIESVACSIFDSYSYPRLHQNNAAFRTMTVRYRGEAHQTGPREHRAFRPRAWAHMTCARPCK